MTNDDGKKQNKITVHLNDETHSAIKKWAKYQGTTMPKLAQSLLEDMNPLLEQLIETYEEIMSGKDKEKALNNFMAKGLTLAAERLKKDDNAEK
jgi:hypothetical protein